MIHSMKFSIVVFCFTLFIGCSDANDESNLPDPIDTGEVITEEEEEENTSSVFAPINFSNWKVTLPIDEDTNGKPDEYQPDQLVDFGYQEITSIQPYMYDDVDDASLVFYTSPGVTTTNSSYSRTELRELINPTTSRENWSLQTGGVMEGELKMIAITEDLESSRTYHRTIVMQIHGIISQEDMDIHGFTSNNGPPLIKMYWEDGHIWSFKKSLVNESTSGDDLLEVGNNTWYDEKTDMGYVGFETFSLKIIASDARLEIILNDQDPLVYQDISLEKWPFENYFKAGNYLQTDTPEGSASLKYYNLTIQH